MTDIDKLEAGPELDALVAEKVMGWSITQPVGPARQETFRISDGKPTGPNLPPTAYGLPPNRDMYGDVRIPKFSTDIDAAWTVVEKLRLIVEPRADGHWAAGWKIDTGPNEVLLNLFEGVTAPMAICRAALHWVKK